MGQSITLGFKEDGSAELLAGPEVDVAEQKEAVKAMRAPADYPKGFVKVEVWRRQKIKTVGRAGVMAPPAPAAAEAKPKPKKKAAAAAATT